MSAITKREEFPKSEIDKTLLKNTLCRDLTDGELELFAHVCKQTGLDPFIKQIYALKRKSKDKNGNWNETMTIQVGIDGLRSIAERTGNYCPGKENSYSYDKDGNLASCTAHIKKRTSDNTWHEISANALMCEYKPSYANNFWNDKPHIMLGKCAEALAIRRAFPSVTGNLYVEEEIAMTSYNAPKIEDISINQEHFQQTEKIDCTPNKPYFSPFEQVETILISKGSDASRLSEWLNLKAQKAGKSLDDIINTCLSVPIQMIQNSYDKWAAESATVASKS